MWRSLFVLLFAISVGYAKNSTAGAEENKDLEVDLLNCTKILKDLFLARKKCIHEFIAHQIRNDTSESDGNCTNLDVMENDFYKPLINYLECWKPDNATRVQSSIKVRLSILRRLQNATNDNSIYARPGAESRIRNLGTNDFNDGLKCVKANKKHIKRDCLKEVLKNETIYTENLSRITPYLYFGPRSCSKESLIMKCTMKTLEEKCPKSNAKELLSFLQNVIINDQCKNTTTNRLQKPKSSSTVPIVIGVLLAIMALFILGLFAKRKLKKMAIERAESLRVSYHADPKEK